jgi:hypothetical protein
MLTRRVQEWPFGDPITRLPVSLGDPALQVALATYPLVPLLDDDGALVTPPSSSSPPSLSTPTRHRLSPAAVVSGSVDIETVAAGAVGQVLSCGEDWKTAALVALFDPADLEKVKLRGQFRWRNGGETEWTKSRLFRSTPRTPFSPTTSSPAPRRPRRVTSGCR